MGIVSAIVYNPDGTLNDIIGWNANGSIAYDYSAGIFPNVTASPQLQTSDRGAFCCVFFSDLGVPSVFLSDCYS